MNELILAGLLGGIGGLTINKIERVVELNSI
jgi:hypothetical protein